MADDEVTISISGKRIVATLSPPMLIGLVLFGIPFLQGMGLGIGCPFLLLFAFLFCIAPLGMGVPLAIIIGKPGVRNLLMHKNTWLKWQDVAFKLQWPFWIIHRRQLPSMMASAFAPPAFWLDDQTLLALNEALQRYAPEDNAYRKSILQSCKNRRLVGVSAPTPSREK